MDAAQPASAAARVPEAHAPRRRRSPLWRGGSRRQVGRSSARRLAVRRYPGVRGDHLPPHQPRPPRRRRPGASVEGMADAAVGRAGMERRAAGVDVPVRRDPSVRAHAVRGRQVQVPGPPLPVLRGGRYPGADGVRRMAADPSCAGRRACRDARGTTARDGRASSRRSARRSYRDSGRRGARQRRASADDADLLGLPLGAGVHCTPASFVHSRSVPHVT